MSKAEIAGLISKSWKILTPEQRDFLYDQLTVRTYRRNEIIFKQGDEPLYMMYLVKGSVKIYYENESERRQIMHIAVPSQFFGYRAYFARRHYSTNACPFETSTLIFIPLKCIEIILHENNDFANQFIHFLAEELGLSDRHNVILNKIHIRGRLAEALLFLKDNYGTESDKHTLRLALTREDLASFSNMNPANCIRTLSAFADEGLIAVNQRHIALLNERKLKKIAMLG